MVDNNDPFAGLNQPDPEPQIFHEDFFYYRHTEEFKREMERGGIHKLLAIIKAIIY